jgi:hypothetical protein
MSLGGFHPAPVGTAEMVADVFEQSVNEANVDGFNIWYTTSLQSFEDIVDLLVPELQKRGLMWEDYSAPSSSLRENLTGVKGQIGVSKDITHINSSTRATSVGLVWRKLRGTGMALRRAKLEY